MKKTIAMMLMFATGCMSLAGCAETDVTVVTESSADEETPDGGYIRNDNGDVIRIELYEDDVLLEYKE